MEVFHLSLATRPFARLRFIGAEVGYKNYGGVYLWMIWEIKGCDNLFSIILCNAQDGDLKAYDIWQDWAWWARDIQQSKWSSLDDLIDGWSDRGVEFTFFIHINYEEICRMLQEARHLRYLEEIKI